MKILLLNTIWQQHNDIQYMMQPEAAAEGDSWLPRLNSNDTHVKVSAVL